MAHFPFRSDMAPTHGLGLDRLGTKKRLISLILVSYGIYVTVIFELYIWVRLRPTQSNVF
jgi:hypothetical protein